MCTTPDSRSPRVFAASKGNVSLADVSRLGPGNCLEGCVDNKLHDRLT